MDLQNSLKTNSHMQRNKQRKPRLELKETKPTNSQRIELEVNYYGEFITCFHDGILMLNYMRSMQHLFEQLEFPCTALCEIFLLVPLAWHSLHYLLLWSHHFSEIKAMKSWTWCTNVMDSYVLLRRQGPIANADKATEPLSSESGF